MLRNDYLIKRKFNSYVVPGVLMIMASQLGNIVDSILVSSFIDIDGMTAISLSLPVLYFMQIIGFAIGVGCAVTISVMLGKRQIKEASGVFSVCIVADIGLSLIFTVIAPFAASPLAGMLAQTPRLEELLMPYIYVYMLLAPLINFCLLVSNVVTIDNCPKLGAACFIIANIVNLGLDYYFLKYTDLGMYGAALSELAIYSVCMNSVEIVRLCIEGVIGVIQTIAGVLYGEKDYFGIRRLVRRTVIIVGIVVIILTSFFIVFPNLILSLFSFNKPELYDNAILCVRLFSLSFAFFAANRIVQVYYQTILATSLATTDTVLQGFAYLLPFSIIFISSTGIIGVSIAAAVTEALAFFTVWGFRIWRQRRGKLPQKGFLMIPDADSDSLFDITIKSTEQEAVEVSRQLIKCCGENGVSGETAGIIGVAAEELAVNIARYGYKKSAPSYIDINISRAEGKLLLRVRDDGVPFNPTEYAPSDGDEFLITGIEMIRRITSKLSYTRVLNMNNTVIEVEAS